MNYRRYKWQYRIILIVTSLLMNMRIRNIQGKLVFLAHFTITNDSIISISWVQWTKNSTFPNIDVIHSMFWFIESNLEIHNLLPMRQLCHWLHYFSCSLLEPFAGRRRGAAGVGPRECRALAHWGLCQIWQSLGWRQHHWRHKCERFAKHAQIRLCQVNELPMLIN